MPHQTIWEDKGILWKYSGIVPLSEVVLANEEFYADTRSDSAKYQIFDATDVDEMTGSEIEVNKIAATDYGSSLTIRLLKVALVVNEQMIPMAEHYVERMQKMGSTWEFGIFGSVEEAREWIGISAKR